ncbi:MAG: hypothetical protein ACXWAT_00135 [Methylobacter sp.]
MRKPLILLILGIALFAGYEKSYADYRSRSAVLKFKKLNQCPDYLVIGGKCTGIVDHKCSLFNGGIDSPINMQWQSYTDSKKKDRIENTREGKRIWCNATNSTPIRQVFNCK